MRKYLLSLAGTLPILGVSAYAAPISMSLFSGGLSILDSLFWIGIGIALLGALFLCIAFLKASSKKEEPIESPFDIYMEEATPANDLETSTDDEDTAPEETDATVVSDSTETPEETPVTSTDPETNSVETLFEKPTPEPEEDALETLPAEPEILESINEEDSNSVEETTEEPEIEPEEEKIYPKLILTNEKTLDFVILPLYEETTVGRKTDNDLVLNDITISGLHCKVLYQDEKVYLQDENSTNGTFVNGERIFEKTELHKGDKILLGKQEFNVSINE